MIQLTGLAHQSAHTYSDSQRDGCRDAPAHASVALSPHQLLDSVEVVLRRTQVNQVPELRKQLVTRSSGTLPVGQPTAGIGASKRMPSVSSNCCMQAHAIKPAIHQIR